MTDCFNTTETAACCNIAHLQQILKIIEKSMDNIVKFNAFLNNPRIKNTKDKIKTAIAKINSFNDLSRKLNELAGYEYDESQALNVATIDQIIETIGKNSFIVNEFSILDENERSKNNPFLAISNEDKEKIITINQRNKITSFNKLHKDINIKLQDLSKTAKLIKEAPFNDLSFIRVKYGWIPFFITPYLATDSSRGFAVYAKAGNEQKPKLTNIKVFKEFINPREEKIKKESLEDNQTYLRKDKKWDKTGKYEYPKEATEEKAGIVRKDSYVSPRDISSYITISKKIAEPADGNEKVIKDNVWVDLDKNVKLAVDSADYQNTSKTQPGYFKLKDNSTNITSDGLTPKTLQKDPFFKNELTKTKHGFFTVKKNKLTEKEIKESDATTEGYTRFANKESEKDKVVDIKMLKEIASRSILYESEDYIIRKHYGFKREPNGKNKMIGIDDYFEIDPEADQENNGRVDLTKALTLSDLLSTLGRNTFAIKDNRIKAVKKGSIQNVDITDFVLFGDIGKDPSYIRTIFEKKNILHISASTTDDLDDDVVYFATLTKASTTSNSYIKIYSVRLQLASERVESIGEINLGKKIFDEKGTAFKIVQNTDPDGNVINKEWICFIVEDVNHVKKLSVHKIFYEENAFGDTVLTKTTQVDKKELLFLSKTDIDVKISVVSLKEKNNITVAVYGNTNFAFFDYFDLSQPKTIKSKYLYIKQLKQAFSHDLIKVLKVWTERQSTSHYMYQYIEEIYQRNSKLSLTSIFVVDDKVVLQIKSEPDIFIVLSDTSKILYDYEIKIKLSYLDENEIVKDYTSIKNKNENRSYLLTQNELTQKYYLVELNKDTVETKKEVSWKNKDKIIGFKKGVLAVCNNTSFITIEEIKNKNIIKDLDWKIQPDDSTDVELEDGLLYITY